MRKDKVLLSIVVILVVSVVILGWQVFKLKRERNMFYDPQSYFPKTPPYFFSFPRMFGGEGLDMFDEMRRIQRQIDRMFEKSLHGGFLNRNMWSWNKESFFSPNVDMEETAKEYVIKVDLPGMDKDKINVEVKGHSLIISGERSRQVVNKSDRFYRQERSFGSFMRVIPLPEDALTDKVSARYNKGVLVIRIPKAVSPQPGGAKKVTVT